MISCVVVEKKKINKYKLERLHTINAYAALSGALFTFSKTIRLLHVKQLHP